MQKEIKTKKQVIKNPIFQIDTNKNSFVINNKKIQQIIDDLIKSKKPFNISKNILQIIDKEALENETHKKEFKKEAYLNKDNLTTYFNDENFFKLKSDKDKLNYILMLYMILLLL
ncbi:MAG: hypothetical protein ACRC4L_01490, partial [Mycoplasma sp.]